MSFWNKAFSLAKNAGTAIANEIESNANEIRELKEKYNSKSDDQLFKILGEDGFFGASKKEKGIVFSILKSRGYTTEDINSRSQNS